MKLLLFFFNVFFLLNLFSQTFPKREFRGSWVSTVWNVDYPSASGLSVATQKAQFISQITELKQAGINVVFIQVRPSCDAFYDSSFEPWSQWLTGTPQNITPSPYYDPLVFYVEECHKRGMELHAWVNPYRAASSIAGQSFSASHITNTQPSWCVTYGTKKLLNPGLPAVRNYVTDVVMEIVRNYDIDGMHFDDYFYPYPEASLTFNDAAAFATDPRGFTNLDNWRRDNVNIFIDKIHDSIKSEKPWVRFGVSPFGIWKSGVPAGISGLSSYFDIYCDPIAWLQDGSVDYVLPQLYWLIGGAQDFSALSNWWGTQCETYNRHCFAGMATYRLDPASGNWANTEIRNQINSVRTINTKVPGYSCFSSKSIINNLKSIQDTLAVKNQKVSLLPAMTWDNNIAPNLVTGVSYSINPSNIVLNWTQATAALDGDLANYYVVYRFVNGQTINLTNPVFISGRTNRDTTVFVDNYTITAGETVTYAITSVDRYSNESLPMYYNICFNCDNEAPNSQIVISNDWKTANFTANFTDIDFAGGTGVEKAYYAIENFDGSKWTANAQRGFAIDDFDAASISSQWVPQTGTWSQATGSISQSDAGVSNTNLHMGLNQNLSNRYVYDFRASIGGAGVNRRVGIHIFASDPTLSERGNSLLIWFRLDDDKIQLYQTNSNLLGAILSVSNFNFVADQVYDFRIIYDRISGILRIYIDGTLATSYTFLSPYTNGEYVSFRSGNANFNIESFRVLRSRAASTGITIGSALTNDVTFQNPSSAISSGRITTFCNDSALNLSATTQELFDVDYTQPILGTFLNDSLAADIDTTYATTLAGNWDISQDIHSEIQQYEISLGTSAGATDIQNWITTNTTNFNSGTLSLIENQQYFVNLRATNGAGLISPILSSDGVVFAIMQVDTIPTDTIETDTLSISEFKNAYLTCYPNPTTKNVTLTFNTDFDGEISLIDLNGKLLFFDKRSLLNGGSVNLDIENYPSGIYMLKINSEKYNTTISLVKN